MHLEAFLINVYKKSQEIKYLLGFLLYKSILK
jgi:hypothetical protein